MKKKNREVNIFSMSALDLFASAMGAFMLLAVIALPFFGNTSKSIPQKCPKIEKCPEVKPCPEVKTCPTVAKPFKKVDLVIVLDISGSMGDELANLKLEIQGIAQILESFSDSSAIRIIVFGDDAFEQPVTSYPLIPVTQQARLQKVVNGIQKNLGMGSGKNNITGESVYGGVAEAINTSWRSGSDLKSIVIITDDEPHPGQSSKLNQAVRQFSSSKNDRVSVIFTEKNIAKQNYYKQLAKTGNGTYFELDKTTITAGIILSLVDK